MMDIDYNKKIQCKNALYLAHMLEKKNTQKNKPKINNFGRFKNFQQITITVFCSVLKI